MNDKGVPLTLLSESSAMLVHHLFLLFLLSAASLCVYLVCILVFSCLLQGRLVTAKEMANSLLAALVSSFGRLFLLLPLLWPYHPAFVSLVHVFVLASNVVALRVVVENKWSIAIGIVATSAIVSLALRGQVWRLIQMFE